MFVDRPVHLHVCRLTPAPLLAGTCIFGRLAPAPPKDIVVRILPLEEIDFGKLARWKLRRR